MRAPLWMSYEYRNVLLLFAKNIKISRARFWMFYGYRIALVPFVKRLKHCARVVLDVLRVQERAYTIQIMICAQ